MRALTTSLLFLVVAVLQVCADQKIPFLNVKGEVYTNVTVLNTTATDVYFKYARGMGNAKLKDLDPEMQKLFRFDPVKAGEAQKKQLQANAQYQQDALTTRTSSTVPIKTEAGVAPASAPEVVVNDLDPKYAQSTLTQRGDSSPLMSLQTLDEGGIDFSGKVVVINFFATWCGPCMKEMPYMETYVWRQFKDAGLVLIAVGRGHTPAEVQAFQKQSGLTFPFAADPTEEIYHKFATDYIPRCVLIGKDGRVKYQTVGFSTEDLSTLIKVANFELKQ